MAFYRFELVVVESEWLRGDESESIRLALSLSSQLQSYWLLNSRDAFAHSSSEHKLHYAGGCWRNECRQSVQIDWRKVMAVVLFVAALLPPAGCDKNINATRTKTRAAIGGAERKYDLVSWWQQRSNKTDENYVSLARSCTQVNQVVVATVLAIKRANEQIERAFFPLTAQCEFHLDNLAPSAIFRGREEEQSDTIVSSASQ